jgi:hypothetical protein
VDYFMLIPGLNGGSLDKQHVSWFEISGFDLDLEKIAGGKLDTLNVTRFTAKNRPRPCAWVATEPAVTAARAPPTMRRPHK